MIEITKVLCLELPSSIDGFITKDSFGNYTLVMNKSSKNTAAEIVKQLNGNRHEKIQIQKNLHV